MCGQRIARLVFAKKFRRAGLVMVERFVPKGFHALAKRRSARSFALRLVSKKAIVSQGRHACLLDRKGSVFVRQVAPTALARLPFNAMQIVANPSRHNWESALKTKCVRLRRLRQPKSVVSAACIVS